MCRGVGVYVQGRQWRVRLSLRQIGSGAALLVATVILLAGCFLDRTGSRIPPGELDVAPDYICPLDPITVSWDVPTHDPCWTDRPPGDDTPRCSTVENSMSNNPETPFNVGLDDISNSITYSPGPSVDTTFSMTTVVFTGSGIGGGELSDSVSVISVPTLVPGIAAGLCGDNGTIDVTALLSRCVEINQICIAAADGSSNPADGRYVVTGWLECAPGTPPDSCLAGSFMSDEKGPGDCIEPEEVGLTSFQGLATVDINLRTDPLSGGGLDPREPDCSLEGSGYNPDLTVYFHTSCTGAYAGCEAGIDGMGGGGDEEEAEPPPTAAGSQPTLASSVTPDTTQDLCSENGGIQFQGEVCVCAGFVDNVTICNDGVKIDQVTDVACTPDPSQCSQDDGSKPDDKPEDPCKNSCGNQSCQPQCGEDPNNCPSDC